MKQLSHLFHQLGSRFFEKSKTPPQMKSVELSNLPFMLDARAIRVRCLKERPVSMLTSNDYVVEVYKNGDWKIWPYVQSFKFEVDVKDFVPKITVQFVDHIEKE